MHTNQPAPALQTKKRKIVILPTGSCEQHGPYLPIDTDLRIAQLIADKVSSLLIDDEVLLLPAIPFSASWEHKGLGTIALNVATISGILHDIASSLKSWNIPVLLILINWHGGNSVLASLATEITAVENISTATIPAIVLAGLVWSDNYEYNPGDVHAGALETSIIQAYWPELIKGDISKGEHYIPNIEPVHSQTALQALGIHKVTKNGTWGNPEYASAAKGKFIIASITEQIRDEMLKLLELVH